MKARRFFTVICICCSLFMLVSCGVEETASTILKSYDFRNFNWGDPEYLVRKEESAQIIYEGIGRLMYWDKSYGYNSNITYCFSEDNKLNHGYIAIESDEEKEVIFKNIASELENLYGEPYEKKENHYRYLGSDNTTIYLSKDGIKVAILYTQN